MLTSPTTFKRQVSKYERTAQNQKEKCLRDPNHYDGIKKVCFKDASKT